MSRNQRLIDMASALHPLPVRDYAVSRNWRRMDFPGRVWVFAHPTEPLRQILIPMDAEAPGFGEAMLDVANRIGELDRRDVVEVLSDLQSPNADTLRFRVVAPEAQGGQVPLIDDINLREGAKRALLAAASSVVNPALHHPRLSRHQADQLLRASLAGQTEIGSYVLKIVCPLNAVDEMPSLFELDQTPGDADPFVRRTTRLLMEATGALVSSIEQDTVDRLIEEDRARPKLSWNLCDALLRMRLENGRVELSVAWAADPATPPPRGVPARVSIPADYFPEVERVATILRPAADSRRNEPLVGTVESLDGIVGDDGRRAGDVVLSVLTEDGDAIKARATLSADQYEMADKAHMDGLGLVLVRGTLSRGARMGRIDEVSEFRPIH